MSQFKKIVINNCFGGFSLSNQCIQMLAEAKQLSEINQHTLQRDDPDLVRIVEEHGKDSWGKFAQLKVVEIPADVNWCIQEYDGNEWVAEVHRTWT